MKTILMNTENSETNERHRFRLTLANKLNLKDPSKNMALANLSIYSIWKNIKSAYNSNNFKISPSTWNDKFDLPDGSYSTSDTQDYFRFIIKKNETLTENAPVQIYINKIKNRILLKKKNRIQIRIFIFRNNEIIKHNKHVDQDKDGEDVSKLESFEIALVYCNLVKNNYKQASTVLFTFVPNKQFDQLSNISPHSLIMLNTTNTEFFSIEVWFTDQNSKSLEIEGNVNMLLIIG